MAARGRRSPAKDPAKTTPHDEAHAQGYEPMRQLMERWPESLEPGEMPSAADPDWVFPTQFPQVEPMVLPQQRRPAELTGGDASPELDGAA